MSLMAKFYVLLQAATLAAAKKCPCKNINATYAHALHNASDSITAREGVKVLSAALANGDDIHVVEAGRDGVIDDFAVLEKMF